MTLPRYLSSPTGRVLRVIAGLALIAVGLWVVQGTFGIVLAVIGMVPLLAGALDFCLIGALFFGTPLAGEGVRRSAGG